jgi:hypothetical protein
MGWQASPCLSFSQECNSLGQLSLEQKGKETTVLIPRGLAHPWSATKNGEAEFSMAGRPGCRAIGKSGVFVDFSLCYFFIPVQLQLSAESAGEVYIKGTETGQYLAMDTEGLLYGSVSVRLTPPDSAKA